MLLFDYLAHPGLLAQVKPSTSYLTWQVMQYAINPTFFKETSIQKHSDFCHFDMHSWNDIHQNYASPIHRLMQAKQWLSLLLPSGEKVSHYQVANGEPASAKWTGRKPGKGNVTSAKIRTTHTGPFAEFHLFLCSEQRDTYFTSRN